MIQKYCACIIISTIFIPNLIINFVLGHEILCFHWIVFPNLYDTLTIQIGKQAVYPLLMLNIMTFGIDDIVTNVEWQESSYKVMSR